MTLSEIRSLPTGVKPFTAAQCQGIDESCLRSYHMLKKVQEWMEVGVPHKVILELIEDTMSAPDWDKETVTDLGTLTLNKRPQGVSGDVGPQDCAGLPIEPVKKGES